MNYQAYKSNTPGNTLSHRFSGSTIVALALLAVGCSSGTGGSAGGSALTPGSVVTRGTLTDAARLTVSDREFATQSAIFSINGVTAQQSDLATGMQVVVRSDGVNAIEVNYDEDVEGPIDIVNVDGSFVVLGQTVMLDAKTVLELPLNHVLTSGDVVEISGLRMADQSILATYVELQSDPVESYEVQGVVENLDLTAMTFSVGSLTVDYSAALLDGFTATGIQNGDSVEISSTNLNYEPGSLLFMASEVELDTDDAASDDSYENDDDDSNGDNDNDQDNATESDSNEYEIEGLVTSIGLDNSFNIGTTVVRFSSNTQFENGDQSSLALDVRVEVEGVLATDNAVDASSIEFNI